MRKMPLLIVAFLAIAGLCRAFDQIDMQIQPDTPADPWLAAIESRPAVPFTPLKESEKFHAVALQLHNRARLDEFRKAIEDIAALGADAVTLGLAAYQKNSEASQIARPEKLVTHEELVGLIGHARKHNLRVLLQPIVLLSEPIGNEWRGRIEPLDHARWWREYEQYIRFAAKAGSEGGATVLYVGSELNRLEACAGQWTRLIQAIRKDFPTLKLSYSANWDRYWRIAFWNDLDYAAVTTYFTLAGPANPDPDADELVEAWDGFEHMGTLFRYRPMLRAWQKSIGKPVIFSEVSYYSKQGVATEPWNYYRPAAVCPQAQANAYEAFLRVWADEPMLGGITFWEWTLDGSGPSDGSYAFKGKPAERLVRNYFARRAARPTTGPDDSAEPN